MLANRDTHEAVQGFRLWTHQFLRFSLLILGNIGFLCVVLSRNSKEKKILRKELALTGSPYDVLFKLCKDELKFAICLLHPCLQR